MRESLVGFCHLVGIFALLDGAANVVGSVDDLGGQASGHGLFTTATAVQSQPAQAEGLAAGGADLQGNLVFLLEKDDWNVIADASDFTPTEDYVLVYGPESVRFLNVRNTSLNTKVTTV